MQKKTLNFTLDREGFEVYHDQALYYISKLEPEKCEELTLRLRATKNAFKSATLVVMSEGELLEYPMESIGAFEDKTGKYEFFETDFNVGEKGFFYCFRLEMSDGKLYYYSQMTDHAPSGEYSLDSELPLKYPDGEQNGWFILPGYKGPEWSRGISWYSIMPDCFYNGDTTNDDMQSDENYDQPWNLHHSGLRDRYGGDFQGIMDKTDYFLDLGVDGIFYDPIQKAEQNAGYGTDDFDQLESTFCNADKYSEFIEYMHGKGLRLMQDVVVYFTTFDGMYINRLDRWPTPRLEMGKGEALNKESLYYNFFCDADNGGHPMWNGLTINHYDPMARELLYGDKETPLIRYADKSQGFGVDGYRYDCGGWITGHEGTSDDYPWENEEQKKGRHTNERTNHVMRTMYDAIRTVNPEFNTLSESSGGVQFRAGVWDSHWLIGLNHNFDKLIDPERGNSFNELYHAMVHSNLKSKPRSGALCSKLQINTHDESKNNMRLERFSAWKSARFIQMTYIGSPSVYYGEEHNFGGTSFKNRYGGMRNGFSFFDWDESRWDHKMRSFFKAMLQLRKEYTAVKTGALYHFGHDDDVISYARFDLNGTVVTLANQTDEGIFQILNAAAVGLTDGTELTDWLTGEKFTVAEGKLSIEVTAGGRVLVTGGKTSCFRLGFTAECGEDCCLDIANEDEKSIKLTSGNFYCLPAFDSFKFSVNIGENSAAVIKNTLCDGAIYYKAELLGDSLIISANGREMARAKCDGNITLYRLADNTFGVEGIKGSEIKLPMNDKVYVGFEAVGKGAVIQCPEIIPFEQRQLADNFDSVPTAMLNRVEDIKTENGYLILNPNSYVIARSTNDD